jgi:biopolymer transport protein ExbD
MPVAKPGKRLLHHIPLKFVQKRVSGGGHKGVNADLNLTSMIDYLVITVVFLLSNFGSQQQVQSTASLEIPEAAHTDNLRSAPIVSISDQSVLLDGQRIATPGEVRNSTDRIDRLFERLEQARREYPVLHPEGHFEGDIVFQIDRRVDWQVIKNVARTCAAAGFVRLNFAVTKGNANTPTS